MFDCPSAVSLLKCFGHEPPEPGGLLLLGFFLLLADQLKEGGFNNSLFESDSSRVLLFLSHDWSVIDGPGCGSVGLGGEKVLDSCAKVFNRLSNFLEKCNSSFNFSFLLFVQRLV